MKSLFVVLLVSAVLVHWWNRKLCFKYGYKATYLYRRFLLLFARGVVLDKSEYFDLVERRLLCLKEERKTSEKKYREYYDVKMAGYTRNKAVIASDSYLDEEFVFVSKVEFLDLCASS
ncbi:MAG: hypothetical protein ACTSXL_02490 [Alphaproteobacteria bacterium]